MLSFRTMQKCVFLISEEIADSYFLLFTKRLINMKLQICCQLNIKNNVYSAVTISIS